MTTETPDLSTDDIEVTLLDAGDIDADHVPVARAGLASVGGLDGETVIYDVASGESHLLNPVATVIWSCFDGSGPIGEIAADLAEAFGIDAETAVGDVQLLAQTLGHKGLLEGVSRFVPAPRAKPEELAEGTAIDPFALPTVGSGELTLADLKGQQVVLINWSARCGYCDRIVPDLVAAQPALAQRGVRLALLSKGEAEEHQKYLDEGLTAPIALVGEDGPQVFPGVGTPAAYVLDESGLVASALFSGAIEVPTLVRGLAGLPEPTSEGSPHDHVHADADDYDEREEEGDEDSEAESESSSVAPEAR